MAVNDAKRSQRWATPTWGSSRIETRSASSSGPRRGGRPESAQARPDEFIRLFDDVRRMSGVSGDQANGFMATGMLLNVVAALDLRWTFREEPARAWVMLPHLAQDARPAMLAQGRPPRLAIARSTPARLAAVPFF